MSDVGGSWWELCDWNDQDAERTLAHAAQFRDLWIADLGDISDDHLEDIERCSAEIDGIIGDPWDPSDARDTPQHRVRVLWKLLTVIADRRAWDGDVVTTHSGVVGQINASGGGVPKRAVESAEIGWRGVHGDVQATRLHHGRPWQALCVWSADVIDAFAAAGHPVTAGGAGENVTLRGVDWASLRGGTMIDIGAVRCQLTAPAVPCSKVAANFTDRDISLIDHDLHPGASRWYAAVLRPGSITIGDDVTISPTAG